ncbi:MAG: VapC toxin family PIN domain ribonuclease [Anaerolineaceae bacterium]|nr:VapC toxin family PIN domain ribonuclease [Anaerolineaceae bacterium]
MSLLVDSSVWIDYFNGQTTAQTDHLDAILGQREIVIGDLILAEVLQGFRRQKDFEQARVALLRFPVLPMVGQEFAIQSAKNYRTLRANGITIRKTIDCLIATFCIENGFQLLHSDRDFDPFAEHFNLQVVKPAPR